MIEQLEQRIVELEARLGKDSSNSSKPPSSDPPWKAPADRKQGRKRGGQPGHRGHKRTFVEPDEIKDYRPTACGRCGDDLSGDDTSPFRHQVTELPEVTAKVTEHRVHALRCQGCGYTTRGSLPADVPRSSFGPRLQAVIAVCSGAYRMSKRSIEELVEDFFGVSIGLGTVANVEQYVSEALTGPVEDAREHVRNARVAHLDETGWFVRAKRAWLWVAVTARVAVFLIRPNRSRKVAFELVPENFRGVICADQYKAYDFIHPDRRQICWAHLCRHFKGLCDYGPAARQFGERIVDATQRMFEKWHQTRDGTVAEVTVALEPARNEIRALLEEGRDSSVDRVRTICRDLLKREASLWTFVRRHDVEPTNNLAERTLRVAVIWRKTSFGTDSESGSRFVECILTVVASLRLQRRPVLAYITEACRAALTGQTAPPIWVHP